MEPIQVQAIRKILEDELRPAMGCTEPIAVAYTAALARELLGVFPQQLTVRCSGNIIKNVKGATVPNSGGEKGIDTPPFWVRSAAGATWNWRYSV